MKIHEYQAKEILAKYGVAVPRGEVANTLEEANAVARKLFAEGASGIVVKAQIHAGGRGKGGGVKLARTREEAELHAKNILGMTLVTHQTGPQGQKVQRLLIEEAASIDRELYLGIVLDRAKGQLVFMASQAGGMEIEEVAAKTPEAIYKETIDPAIGFGDIWEGGPNSTADADYGWMYDDGYGGTNVDCTTPTSQRCWGHRDIILADNIPGAMVAGAGFKNGLSHGSSYAFGVAGYAPGPRLVFSWAGELRYFQVPPGAEPLGPEHSYQLVPASS